MNNKIYSEVSPLRLVITHKPGIEHSFITPNNIKEKIQINGELKRMIQINLDSIVLFMS